MKCSTGPSQRIDPSYTFTRYTPTGFVTARMTSEKRRIWVHPFTVTSELLRAQQRVHEVDQRHDGDDGADGGLEAHDSRSSPVAPRPSTARPCTNASITPKNT